jgi:S-adenosylmethionine:diacylglycerol 3-amino-3-carboxypropyl transferase
MRPLFNFGLSQEDERTEARALDLSPADRVLCVASAGDMPLSLLALGAACVHAVDIDAGQLELARLKAAAVCALERAEALRFLGFLPASKRERLGWHEAVAEQLPDASVRFWQAHREVLGEGAIWAGRFERYIRRLAPLLVAGLGRRRVERFFDSPTLEEQHERYRATFDRWPVRALFRVAFDPRVFRRRGMDPRSLSQRRSARPLGEQYFEQFRQLCTATPAGQNHLFQLMLLGRVREDDAVPAYLSAEGARRVRERRDHLHFYHSDLAEWLKAAPAGGFNKVHLSNVPDWLDATAFDEVMRLVCDRAERPARVVWRYIHVDRALPADLRDVLVIEREDGRALARADRFPFYSIVPARLGDAAAAA